MHVHNLFQFGEISLLQDQVLPAPDRDVDQDIEPDRVDTILVSFAESASRHGGDLSRGLWDRLTVRPAWINDDPKLGPQLTEDGRPIYYLVFGHHRFEAFRLSTLEAPDTPLMVVCVDIDEDEAYTDSMIENNPDFDRSATQLSVEIGRILRRAAINPTEHGFDGEAPDAKAGKVMMVSGPDKLFTQVSGKIWHSLVSDDKLSRTYSDQLLSGKLIDAHDAGDNATGLSPSMISRARRLLILQRTGLLLAGATRKLTRREIEAMPAKVDVAKVRKAILTDKQRPLSAEDLSAYFKAIKDEDEEAGSGQPWLTRLGKLRDEQEPDAPTASSAISNVSDLLSSQRGKLNDLFGGKEPVKVNMSCTIADVTALITAIEDSERGLKTLRGQCVEVNDKLKARAAKAKAKNDAKRAADAIARNERLKAASVPKAKTA